MPEKTTICWNCSSVVIEYQYAAGGHRYGVCARCGATLTELPKPGQPPLLASTPQTKNTLGANNPRPIRRKKKKDV
jgi:hypothetical protein